MPNVELAEKTLAHIEELERRREAGELTDEAWVQGDWGCQVTNNYDLVERLPNFCGTAMCFAGWAVKLAGLNLVPVPTGHDHGYSRMAVADADGNTLHTSIATTAATLLDLPLGVDGDRDERIFGAGNTLDDLRALVAGLKDETYTSITPETEYE